MQSGGDLNATLVVMEALGSEPRDLSDAVEQTMEAAPGGRG